MKFLAILSVVVSIACIHSQVAKNGRIDAPIPQNLVPATIKILTNTPSTVTLAQVRRAIFQRPKNIAGAAIIFAPAFASMIRSISGFNIPLNSEVFVQKMEKALEDGTLDKFTIFINIIESMKTPPSGPFKQLILNIISNFMDSIAPVLPGLNAKKPMILRTIDENNRKPNGLINSLIKILSRLPFGGLFKFATMQFYSIFLAGFEGLAAYRDNPMPILNALFHIMKHQI